jgi:SPASM domain peptide maturase of grasp-with-spasm system
MDYDSKTWFKLFASCILVKGESNSIIYDIERLAFYDLPNDFFDILQMSKTKNINSIKKAYNHRHDYQIDEFFNQFIKEEIGFYTNEPEAFPEIDLTWESPYTITNSIIELDNLAEFNFEGVIHQLNALACRAIEIRLLNSFSNNELKALIKVFKDSRINHIDLLMPYNSDFNNIDLFDLIKDEYRLSRVMVYSAPEDKIINHEDELLDNIIIYFKKDLRLEPNEIIKKERFITNIEIFSEAQNYNIGLNRKVCIDRTGMIKNYFSHDKSFGNVKNDKIKDVIEKSSFQEKWGISNDKIVSCKDCQYRYSCVSNSDIKKENDKYFKIDMCSFDSATNTWNEN